MVPRPEIAHWLTGPSACSSGCSSCRRRSSARRVFRRRPWRAYLWPSIALGGGVMLWVIVVFSTFSAMHLLAHAVWAQAAMVVGAVQLAVVRGKLASPRWSLLTSGALFLSGVAFIVHEQNPWLFSRSAFLHHAIGWVVVVAALFPLGEALRPRAVAWRAGFALTFVVVAVLLFADRDLAPIFGRLSDTAVR